MLVRLPCVLCGIVILFLLVIIAIISALLFQKFKPEEDLPTSIPTIPVVTTTEPPKEETKQPKVLYL